ncbi:hypothetical protein [Sulfodiicoccus acidiphilus]|uniref:hypothetical protein n=1 Tax=Sulfodiicoccus acidiphilus TaxID=1670455 RepID=UPI000F83A02D|nr:hypothetical protein [Sulfodiicoccus acidiphilus]
MRGRDINERRPDVATRNWAVREGPNDLLDVSLPVPPRETCILHVNHIYGLPTSASPCLAIEG